MTISKLNIQLALRTTPIQNNYKQFPNYDVLSFDFNISEKAIQKFKEKKDNPGSFLTSKLLLKVDEDTRGLLRLVEYTTLGLFNGSSQTIYHNYGKYFYHLSWAYFGFLDEKEQTLFSSPHITSPVIFNPNGGIGSYTLEESAYYNVNNKVRYTSLRSNLSKQVDLEIIKQEVDAYHRKAILRDKQEAGLHLLRNEQQIVNSLFNYTSCIHRNNGLHTSNVRSVYQQESSQVDLDIQTVSGYTQRTFCLITDQDTDIMF